MSKKLWFDILTFTAYTFSISFAYTQNIVIFIFLLTVTALAFLWTLERNVQYGMEISKYEFLEKNLEFLREKTKKKEE